MIIDFIFKKLGFTVSQSGILVTTNKFARFIANTAVRNNQIQSLTKDVYTINLR